MNKLEVLFADDAVVVVDKPAGLASVASAGSQGRTCTSEIQRQFRTARPVHRLDRETSGVMVFALTAAAAPATSAMRHPLSARSIAATVIDATP